MVDKNGQAHAPKGDRNGGQFVSKAASESKAEQEQPERKLEKAVRTYSDDPERDMREIGTPSKGKNKSREEFFGEEFKGVKGAAAIEKLLHEKRGHVKNAFERPEIGGIDLVWGDANGGLLHTIQKRNKLFAKGKGTISGNEMVKKIPDIIEKGKFDIDDRDRIGFIHNGYRVSIRPTYYDEKLNWVITAFEIF